jgi:hypothetical protein
MIESGMGINGLLVNMKDKTEDKTGEQNPLEA